MRRVLDDPGAPMALDRPYEDGSGEALPERWADHDRPGADAAGARAELTEPRTRAEYYEVLRAADGGSAHDSETQRPADSETGQSGWDAVDEAPNRPPSDGFRVTPERATHILDGDADGSGGHRHGTGRPGKTEFPASWDGAKIVSHALDVAKRPDQPPVHQHWNDRWLCIGTRDSVEVSVVVLRGGEVWTAWPEEDSPGVVRNPRKEMS
jgi:hypothetical protein